ncbi:hypothetical protein [Spirosoma fluminis]
MIHETPSPLAGKTVQIKSYVSEYGGQILEVEDWWDRIAGRSWVESEDRPETRIYPFRAGFERLTPDNDVVFGSIGDNKLLMHLSELVTDEPLSLVDLSENAVNWTYYQCMTVKPNDENTILVAGVQGGAQFEPARIETYRPQILHYLEQLPQQFRKSGGGGWSFLNMNEDKDGRQWADLHISMDKLICLGKAIGVLTTTPNDLNEALPGGMPYVFLDL